VQISNVANEYYQSLNLDKYSLPFDDKQAICSFYDFFQADSSKNSLIEPIEKNIFDGIMNDCKFKASFPNLCILWCDGNSNYAGVYIAGLLYGKVAIISHEYPIDVPLFRNIQSFVDTVKSGKLALLTIPKFADGYFPIRDLTEQDEIRDFEIAKHLLSDLPSIKNDDFYYNAAIKAMYLMPKEYIHLLIPLLKCEHKDVAHDIAKVFSFYECKEKIPYTS
jgi:hypothetical protein